MGNRYLWNKGATGGEWSTAADWTNQATGQPAIQPPMAGDTATVDGGTLLTFQILAGTGADATLLMLGNTALEGQFSTSGTLTLGALAATPPYSDANAVGIEATTTLRATALALYSNLQADGAHAALIVRTATQGSTSGAAELLVLDTARASATSWTLARGDIYVDPTATFEIGTAGGAKAGVLTIDKSAQLTLAGNAIVNNGITDDGTLNATGTGGSVQTVAGRVSGAGTIAVGQGATLDLSDGAASLAAITVANSGSLSVVQPVTGIGMIETGTGASLTFYNDVTGVGPVLMGSSADADFLGNLSGSSSLAIGAGAAVTINGTLSGMTGATLASGAALTFGQPGNPAAADMGVPITLAGADTLALANDAVISGAVTNFDSTDVIEHLSFDLSVGLIPATAATYTPGTGGTGTLVLSDDGVTLDTIRLAGDYTGQRFLTNFAQLFDGTTQVTLPVGTTHGLPGSGTVTVTGASGIFFQALAGSGSANWLNFIGNTAIEGSFTAGTAVIAAGSAAALNVTNIEAGGRLTVTSVALIETGMEVDGAGATLTANGGGSRSAEGRAKPNSTWSMAAACRLACCSSPARRTGSRRRSTPGCSRSMPIPAPRSALPAPRRARGRSRSMPAPRSSAAA